MPDGADPLAEFVELGVFDPDSPDASWVRAVLERAVALGIPVEEVVQAHAAGLVQHSVYDWLLRPGDRITLAEVAARAGLEPDVVLRFWRAWGFADRDPGERCFTDSDVDAMVFLREMAELVGEDLALHTARAIGTGIARIAEAEASLVRSQLETPMFEQGAAYADILDRYQQVIDWALPATTRAIDVVHRHHLAQIARRYTEWDVPPSELHVFDMAVGFADLADSSRIAQANDLARFDHVISVFEERASDLIAASGASLVKRLGDGVMFVTPAAGVACRLALDLVAAFPDDDVVPQVRVGLAVGPVVARRGDFFGAAVHLAARLLAEAAPATVVVSNELRNRVRGVSSEFAFDLVGPRQIPGFTGYERLFVLRRA